MACPYRTLLFDLDGTVFESGEGILQTARETLAHFNHPVPPPDELRRFVGPPSNESYETIAGMPRELARQAGDYHRALYRAGNWRLSRYYPGMQELLRDLRKAGFGLAVASSKPRPAAMQMAEAFSLYDYFSFLSCTNDNGGGGGKPELIARALEALGERDRSAALMIGDTKYDAAGARDAGVPFLGVLYGYGRRAEMEAEGASRFVPSVEQLRAFLLPG